MPNKNLLIALGDSWTEGVGCYTDEIVSKYKSDKITKDEAFNLGRQHFNLNSWPTVLSELLNFDVINLGLAGSSNSAMSKLLINEYDINYKDDYENVYVIFLISEPARISFYSDKKIQSWQPSGNPIDPIMEIYIKEIMHSNYDIDMESVFALKTINYYCQAKGYKFFYGSAFYNVSSSLNTLFNLPNQNFHNFMKEQSMIHIVNTHELKSQLECGHPNQKGYNVIANKMHSIIVENKWI